MNTTQRSAVPVYGTTQPCALHKYHAPHDTYREVHHIIPREWQAVWAPPAEVERPYLKRVDGKWLWDGRTVSICRTGHGNVHFYLVKIMHQLEPLEESERDPWRAYGVLRREYEGAVDTYAFTTAMTGLWRFLDQAHSLNPLFSSGAYGQI